MLAHPGQGSMHLIQLVVGAALRGEARGGGLQQVAQFEQVAHEGRVWLFGEHPGQDVGIEDIPPLARGDAGAGLRAAFQEAFGDQRADRLAIGRAGDAQRMAMLDLARQRIARLIVAVQDRGAELAGDRLMNPQPRPLLVRP
jgi:hypothetical protein